MKKLLILLLLASFAYADVVWPALYLEIRLLSFFPIIAGLIVEYFFTLYFLEKNPIKAFIATFLANLISVLLGILLIPLSGIIWGIFPGIILNGLFDISNFSPIDWIGTFILAVLVNVALEGFFYKKFFKLKTFLKTKLSLWLFLANSISVGIAMTSLYLNPIYL